MSTKEFERRVILCGCRITAFAIDGLSSFALYKIIREITGEIPYAIAWAAAFFLLNALVHALKKHAIPGDKTPLILALHGVKVSIALFEAVIIYDTFIHPNSTQAATSIIEIVKQAFHNDPAFIGVLIGIIYGLDFLANLLPHELGEKITSEENRIAVGDKCEIPFVIRASPRKFYIMIKYSISLYPFNALLVLPFMIFCFPIFLTIYFTFVTDVPN